MKGDGTPKWMTVTPLDPHGSTHAGDPYAPATLVIEEEPEWTVGFRDLGAVLIYPGGGSTWQEMSVQESYYVRAPDAVTALQRALEQRGHE